MKQIPRYISTIPLDADHVDELCQDILQQHEQGVMDCALFIMSLHPEATPPVKKAEIYAEKYARFKEKLDAMGVRSGVLVQSSIGHGYVLSEPTTFQKIVNLNNGEVKTTCCPYDDTFCDYLRHSLTVIAGTRPSMIMVDDDLRLIFREGNGCACELHMKAVRELLGEEISREELFEELKNDNRGRYAQAFLETQKQAVLKASKAIREGIDTVDPTIPVMVCACGNAEFTEEMAEVMAGQGNPRTVRVNNGVYVPEGARRITQPFYRAAVQIAKLKGKVDAFLGESDTIPYNQYAMSARWIHSHFVGTVLEGVCGAKRWITRRVEFEPESGQCYRKTFSENRGFYDELIRIVPSVRYFGCRTPLSADAPYYFSENGWNSINDGGGGWAVHVLERLGLPMYFSAAPGGAAFLCGRADTKFSDQELLDMLGGCVILSSDSAKQLVDRGFGKHLGVDVREWTGELPNAEKLRGLEKKVHMQYKVKELVVTDDRTRVESMIYHTADNENFTPLFPGCTAFRNDLGGLVVVYAGTPVAPFNYVTGFSFLNWSRKEQMISLLSESGAIPLYFPGTEEIYLRAGTMDDGRVFAALFDLGLDPLDRIELVSDFAITKVSALEKDGSYAELSFRQEGRRLVIDRRVEPVDPVILVMEKK